jgi:oligopeptide transport system permease protein
MTVCSFLQKSIFSNKILLTGLCILSIIFFLALFGPYFNSHLSEQIHLTYKNLPPNQTFWFGTDELGRDLLTRTFQGARISLFIAICSAVIDLCIGVCFGAIAAYLGGYKDHLMMRICDIINSIPNLLLVILLIVMLGPGLGTIIIALSCTGWINIARIARLKVLQIKTTDFVKISYCLGASSMHIMCYHILPNCTIPIIATVALTIPNAIFSEAFLSFLGLGIQAPKASWGTMASDALSALRYYPWRIFAPSIMIFFTMLGFHLVGNGLRESLDPRQLEK